MRLVKGWSVDDNLTQPEVNKVSIAWFDAVLNAALADINDLFLKYKLSEAQRAIYKLIWDDFCSWLLEMIKPAYQQPIDRPTLDSAISFFDKLLKVLHPFMPFITEEIWQLLIERKNDESIMMTSMPVSGIFDSALIQKFVFAKEVITMIRTVRKEQNIPQKDSIPLFIRKNNDEKPDTTFDAVTCKLCNILEFAYVAEKVPGAISFVAGSTEFYIPLSGSFNLEEEKRKMEEELAYTQGFLEKVKQKLNKESFVQNAPEKIVAIEQKKRDDAEARIRVLEEKIRSFSE